MMKHLLLIIVLISMLLLLVVQSFTPLLTNSIRLQQHGIVPVSSATTTKSINSNNIFGIRFQNDIVVKSSSPTLVPVKSSSSLSLSSTTTNFVEGVDVNQQQQDEDKLQYFQNVANDMRLQHLEEQAMYALQIAVEQYGTNTMFSNALIAGDVVITDLLFRMGYLQRNVNAANAAVQIMVIDTFHLFPSTIEFLHTLENKYNFNATIFAAKDILIGNKQEYDTKYGADLWKTNIDKYDYISKVEPYQRGLQTLNASSIITGRTRWQGAERAWINIFEKEDKQDGQIKINPIAYWTLEDVFNYIQKYKIPYHPLHEQGYPSIGDAKDTFPVPDDGSVRFQNYTCVGDKDIWLDYGKERSGRFIGLKNSDGTTKTECGIHVNSADRTWERDLWEEGISSVVKIHTPEEASAIINSNRTSIVVVYAPWCPFSQRMEDEYEKFAQVTQQDSNQNVDVYSFRGDDQREYVINNLNTKSFPTINIITSTGTVIKYESEIRTVDAFQKFLYDNTQQKEIMK